MRSWLVNCYTVPYPAFINPTWCEYLCFSANLPVLLSIHHRILEDNYFCLGIVLHLVNKNICLEIIMVVKYHVLSFVKSLINYCSMNLESPS